MKKRILHFRMIVKVVMIGLLIGVSGMVYGQNFTVGDLNYSVNEDGVSVTVRGHVNGTSASGILSIPETITYDGVSYSVKGIRNQAFKGCSGLTGSLVIPNSITQIGEYAFKNCSGFNGTLTIGTAVNSIEEEAFANTGFIAVNFNPTNCTKMGYHREDGDWDGSPVFLNCSSIATLNIGNNVTRIPVYAFESCSGLSGNLNLPDALTSIGYGAFYGCSGFVGDLTIPDAVTSIGGSAFWGCNRFDGILTIPSSVNGIGDCAFWNCTNFTEIHYNATNCSNNREGTTAFSGCTATLIIGDNVLNIPNYLFCSGSFTGNLVIPESVTRIGEGAFSGCYQLTGNLTIPNSVVSIGNWAFSGCSHFSGILTIGNSVSSIGYLAFAYCGFTGIHYNATNCSDLTPIYNYLGHNPPFEGCNSELVIGENVTKIPCNIFRDQGNNHGIIIGNLTIPNSVKTIGDYAFAGNPRLNGIMSLPNSLVSVGEKAFYETGWYAQQPDGILYLDNWCLGYKGEKPTGNLEFQEGTKGIAAAAFSNCTGLIGDLTIPNSISRLPKYAFSGCTGFDGALTIPNSIISIGDKVFYNCNHFTTINYYALNCAFTPQYYNTNHPFENCSGNLVIGDNVETIPDFVFKNSGISGNLIIPNSLFSIGHDAFYNCNGLSAVYYSGSIAQWCDMVFMGYGSNPLLYAHNLYINNEMVTDLVIPETITSIKNYAFFGGTCITSLTIPDSVISIGNYAFYDCSGITTISIPNSVISIGFNAFDGTGWYNNLPNGIIYSDECCLGYKGNRPTGALSIVNGTRLIAAQAFYFCNGLTLLEIPNTMITIGDNAFERCNSLTEVIVFGVNTPSLGLYGFYGVSCPIYVPYESLEIYQTATNWSDYKNQILPMAYTNIPGYADSNNNWQFIASPLAESTAPTTIDDMLPTNGTYDLYQFNQSARDGEWQNYKANSFDLTNGQGYLYANTEEVNLIFKGEFNEDETKEVNLVYDVGKPLAGWNLVGNPFPVNTYVNRSYYVMNEAGTAIEPIAVSMETAIAPCTGVMVKADNAGETVTFSKTMPEMVPNQGNIQIAVMQTNKSGVSMMDKAIISFNVGDRLEKFVFNKDNAQLYIPGGKNNYAIACTEKTGEMPLDFKAIKNGVYTIQVNAETAEMEYLHLIDNITGNDVDLLVEPCYTFEAKTNDYASRFRLVFICGDANDDNEGENETSFAYICNGDIIITADAYDASLQVIDAMGHVVVTADGRTRYVPTAGMASGVYVLRLINGDETRVQKIVIK